MLHSKALEETKLWKIYTEKSKNDYNRLKWTKEVYESACEQLKAVRDTFDNYTLHDEIHVLNVLDVMAGLLGNRIEELTVGEAELLILSSALHDIGMVYTKQSRESCFTNKMGLDKYCSTHPELRYIDLEDWDEFTKQDYLRWLHPFRIEDVLQQPEWQEAFIKRPKEAVPEDVLIAVCRSHGETPTIIRKEATEKNGKLAYLRFKDIDPLFCAIILRLADILDFDDSRAPSILFSYAGRSLESVEEWKKHIDSMGFSFPSIPSSDNLPYGASFSNPNIERSARTFLDWIDEELSNSRNLIALTCDRWNSFPFPYQIDRGEIERIGYDFGDFRITMDQNQIMELLVGENLYSDRSVFVRELLQNAIDATLLRAEMDLSFTNKINTDAARIDLWEWWDDNGDLWFRIDDHGTGMTRGMLEKYFLKVGNSYYNSQELKRELNGNSFSSISRFGIGFLSCFLCGIEAYVSTTYWNPEKNIQEAERDPRIHLEQSGYGLRLDVVGLTGYYTLRNQSIINNRPSPLPSPPASVPHPDANYEKDGFRTAPGTSIVIRIDSGKLGSRSLLEVAKYWTCFPRMPIYYNGKQLCLTEDELFTLAEDERGIIEYELSEEEKLRFDSFLPELQSTYPRIRETIELFDAGQVPGLPRLKILLCETKVLVSNEKRLWRNGYGYTCTGCSWLHKPEITIPYAGEDNEDLVLSFRSRDSRRIFDILSDNKLFMSDTHYGWKGIFVDHTNGYYYKVSPTVIIIDEDETKPVLRVNRDSLVSVPLKTAITTLVWLENHSFVDRYSYNAARLSRVTLNQWRTLFSTEYQKWIDVPSLKKYELLKKALEKGITNKKKMPQELSEDSGSNTLFLRSHSDGDIRWLFLAYMQLHYRILVDYSIQQLRFCELDSPETETQFDLFPLMPFCYGKTNEDRAILCSADNALRVAITANHPFMKWLVDNSVELDKHYSRQFNQIVNALRYSDADKLIKTINQIIEQLSKTSYRHGIKASDCPKLTKDDFWVP